MLRYLLICLLFLGLQLGSKKEDLTVGTKIGEKSDQRNLGYSAKSLQIVANRLFLGLPLFLWFIISLAVICSIVTTSIILSKSSSLDTSLPLPPGADDKIYIGDPSHVFFSKKMWGGLNASSKVLIEEPTVYVIISHTVSRFCYENQTCQELVQGMQKDHMSRSPAFADIAFNFLVGGDGNVYEGRGWGVRSPHEGFVNNKNIDITFIGDFSVYDVPTPTQTDAVKKLIERGVEDCHLSANYILISHNGTETTLSPGKNVYSIISKWPHFDPNPRSHIPRHLGMERICAEVVTPYAGEEKKD